MKKKIKICDGQGFRIGDILHFKSAPHVRGIVRDCGGFVSRVYFFDVYGDITPQTLTLSNFDLLSQLSHIERAR